MTDQGAIALGLIEAELGESTVDLAEVAAAPEQAVALLVFMVRAAQHLYRLGVLYRDWKVRRCRAVVGRPAGDMALTPCLDRCVHVHSGPTWSSCRAPTGSRAWWTSASQQGWASRGRTVTITRRCE